MSERENERANEPTNDQKNDPQNEPPNDQENQPRRVPRTSHVRSASDPRKRLQQPRACVHRFECRIGRGGEGAVAVAALATVAAELRRGAALLQHLPRRASCRHRGESRR